MLDFFDSLQVSILLGLNAYFRETEKKKAERQQFISTTYTAIGNSAEKMASTILDAVIQVYEKDSYPAVLAEGTVNLPIYAMLRVLKRQSTVSPEQKEIINLFFRNLSVAYTQNDFYAAVRNSGGLEKTLQDSVGLMPQAGAFWNHFFSAMRVLQQKNDIFGKIVQSYSDFVINFSALGSNSTSVAENEIRLFISCLSAEYEKSFQNPKGFDYIGERDWKYYKERIEKTAYYLAEVAGDSELPDMTQLLNNHFETMIYNLVQKTRQSEAQKREDYIFALAYTDSEKTTSAQEIFNMACSNFEISEFYASFPSTFIEIIGVLGTKANLLDQSENVVRYSIDFLLDVERVLKNKSPNVGYEDLVRRYFADVLKQALH